MRGVHSTACMRFIRYSREGGWDAHHYWGEPSPCSMPAGVWLSSSRRVVRSNALSDPVIGLRHRAHPRALGRRMHHTGGRPACHFTGEPRAPTLAITRDSNQLSCPSGAALPLAILGAVGYAPVD